MSAEILRDGLGTLLYCPRTLRSSVEILRDGLGTPLYSPRTLRSSAEILRDGLETLLYSPRTFRSKAEFLRDGLGTLLYCPRTLQSSVEVLRDGLGTLLYCPRSLRSLSQDCRQDSCAASTSLAQVLKLFAQSSSTTSCPKLVSRIFLYPNSRFKISIPLSRYLLGKLCEKSPKPDSTDLKYLF